ncbi:conserved hypothetical protein [Culex quinquefasciatus]|uniref:Odorant receptor n=1 Tax=Culex quinquefasciatus TaxID=7176 RepID=B0XCB4_CULQU|nr:conserved hypothetical protein [Culex quinquefasciatus]|eukprot:XP_001867286.1 conserved hypothetical protein [Culex quinquefasciatus]
MFNRTKKYITNRWRSHVQLNSKTDHFFILNFFLSFAGVYFPGKNDFFKLAWRVFRVCMILHYAMILRRLLQTLTMEHSSDLLINGIHVAMGATLMLTRSLLIQANFGHFKQVRKHLNERSFRVDDPDVQRIRQQPYELSVKVTVFFIGNIIFQFISITSSGITDMDPFQLPFSMKEFSVFEQKFYSGMYSLLWTVYSLIAASNFLTIYLGLIGLIGLSPLILSGRLWIEWMSDLSSNQDELNTCIEHHSKILNNLKVFKNLTNLSFLLLYYMTMAHTAIGVIIVIFHATLDTFTIMGVEFTLRYLIECYPWITRLRCRKEFAGQYRQVRATILIVAMQSQRSLNISTGGLFELTLDKFTSLIKKSYTLMMVVWNMKQGEGVACIHLSNTD